MGEYTSIEWCHHTFNPWWGCEKVSPACAHCYAEAWAKRTGFAIWGQDAPRRFFADHHWNEPLRWDRRAELEGVRRRVFCASMADVFEGRQDLESLRARLWDLIVRTPHLDWLLLTKRPENVLAMVPWGQSWPANVWPGTTVENQEWAERRIPFLIRVPARIRFLSCEPLLCPIDLSPWIQSIHWVIAGGESGQGARVMQPEWITDLRDQVVGAGVAFHFKQWGEWRPGKDGMEKFGKKAAGRMLEGRTWDGIPL